jgi:hypothetical protein
MDGRGQKIRPIDELRDQEKKGENNLPMLELLRFVHAARLL